MIHLEALKLARAGERVLVVVGTRQRARDLFLSAVDVVGREGVVARRATGAETIELVPGGSLRFTEGNGARGAVADVVVTDVHTLTDPDTVRAITPVVATTGGRIVAFGR